MRSMNYVDLGNPIEKSEPSKRRSLFWKGMAASSIYIIALVTYAIVQIKPMLQMNPDEFATFLSGIFAPLAFLWLVLGFRQQGDELQNSARALWLQGEELRNSVEQQRQLVQVSRDQLAAEVEDRKLAEVMADRNAQPILTMPSGGGQYQGERRTLTFHIHSAGPTCSDVRIFLDRVEEVVRYPVLQNGESIGFSKTFERSEDVVPLEVMIRYVDLRGRGKYQLFHIPVLETGAPSGGKTLGDPYRNNTDAWDLTDC
jgi:hypothetical protein